MALKIYIVEDHEDMRFLLVALLQRSFKHVEIVGESESAERALKEIGSANPDLILVDIFLPAMNGLELVRRLRKQFKQLKILVVTGHEIDLYRNEALSSGADGIFPKGDLKALVNRIGSLMPDCATAKR